MQQAAHIRWHRDLSECGVVCVATNVAYWHIFAVLSGWK
jgi:hypothetical protein